MPAAKPRVLVVDDDHDCRLLLSTIAAQTGYDVDAVADGDMALLTLRARPPDLVLLDAYLPGQDGFQVCRSIKGNPATQRTPVIILTAFSSVEAREMSLEAGADEFVSKPFRAEVLVELMEQLLAIKRAAEHLDPGERAVVEGLGKRSI
jgi:DNA-binding response OmpR family regulator